MWFISKRKHEDEVDCLDAHLAYQRLEIVRLRRALREIKKQKTEKANATVKRMATIAEQTLESNLTLPTD
jgi:hypothetical protein